MDFPLTYEDEFSFPADHTYSMGAPTEEAQGTFRPDDQISAHCEPKMPWYDEYQSLNSLAFNGTLFAVFFEPSNQATTEDIPASQSSPSSAYTPSISTLHISVDAPAVATVAPASTITAPTPSTNVTTRRRFRCPLCPKTFDRLTRAEACHNEHLDWKPHTCHGVCGDINCTAAYFSIENLRRHTRVLTRRKVTCPYCTRSFLKQNISRHKKSCL